MKKVREVEFIKMWTAYVVCTLFGGYAASVFVGLLLGFVLAFFDVDNSTIDKLGTTIGILVGLFISYWFFKVFSSKILDVWISNNTKEPNQTLEPTATAVTDRAAHAPRQP